MFSILTVSLINQLKKYSNGQETVSSVVMWLLSIQSTFEVHTYSLQYRDQVVELRVQLNEIDMAFS
jgi:hypothetical protein